ncbi:Bile salt-activated lipase [Merluccius polli]|uniref:Bile salt-activated lipase n=1 Tax=Merluccius polli TaxID=89951 RepID=A0AA47M4J9_MERPO|nr:Bile salt-activated lipase [Merluccius polli]
MFGIPPRSIGLLLVVFTHTALTETHLTMSGVGHNVILSCRSWVGSCSDVTWGHQTPSVSVAVVLKAGRLYMDSYCALHVDNITQADVGRYWCSGNVYDIHHLSIITVPTTSSNNTRPVPTMSSDNTRPVPTTSSNNTRPVPTTPSYNTRPVPTTSSNNTRPVPSTSSNNTRPVPTTSSNNTRPAPTTSSNNTRPVPTTSSNNTRPVPTTSSNNTRPAPTTSSNNTRPAPTTSSNNTRPVPTTSSNNTRPAPTTPHHILTLTQLCSNISAVLEHVVGTPGGPRRVARGSVKSLLQHKHIDIYGQISSVPTSSLVPGGVRVTLSCSLLTVYGYEGCSDAEFRGVTLKWKDDIQQDSNPLIQRNSTCDVLLTVTIQRNITFSCQALVNDRVQSTVEIPVLLPDGVPSGYVVIAVAVGGCFAMMVMLALIEVKKKRKTNDQLVTHPERSPYVNTVINTLSIYTSSTHSMGVATAVEDVTYADVSVPSRGTGR